ncbi:hypothetical protein [Desulfonatronum thiodismutans]|uniref:hypothetical protein n=1 Tax=Desulfonatronum thiodismutans TaxID=159290 RepID=UPI0004ABE964|nr:hypothetical protein [Desulfonatronum thiodismutans]
MLTAEIQKVTGPIFERLGRDHGSEFDAYKARLVAGQKLTMAEMQQKFPHVLDYWKARFRAKAQAGKPAADNTQSPKPARVYTDPAQAVAAAENETIDLFAAMYGEQAGNRLRRACEDRKMANANPEAFYRTQPQTTAPTPPPARTESPMVIEARRRAGLRVDHPLEGESPLVANARLRAAKEHSSAENPLIANARRRAEAAKEGQHDS